MDFDAIIDKELEALSDFSSICSGESEEDSNFLTSPINTTEDNEWVTLFLAKTSQQADKTATLLDDAQDVLNEVHQIEAWSQSRCQTVKPEIINSEDLHDDEIYPSAIIPNDMPLQQQNTKNQGFDDQQKGDSDPKLTDESIRNLEERLSKIADTFESHKCESQLRVDAMEKACQEEVIEEMDKIESQRIEMQERLQQMAAAEMQILSELSKQREFYQKEKQNKAACLLQATYRGFRARKQYGKELEKRIQQSKQRRREERIASIEAARKAKEAELLESNLQQIEPDNNVGNTVKKGERPITDTPNSAMYQSVLEATHIESETRSGQAKHTIQIEIFPNEVSAEANKSKPSLVEEIYKDLDVLSGTSSIHVPKKQGKLNQQHDKLDVAIEKPVCKDSAISKHVAQTTLSSIDKDLQELGKSVHLEHPALDLSVVNENTTQELISGNDLNKFPPTPQTFIPTGEEMTEVASVAQKMGSSVSVFNNTRELFSDNDLKKFPTPSQKCIPAEIKKTEDVTVSPKPDSSVSISDSDNYPIQDVVQAFSVEASSSASECLHTRETSMDTLSDPDSIHFRNSEVVVVNSRDTHLEARADAKKQIEQVSVIEPSMIVEELHEREENGETKNVHSDNLNLNNAFQNKGSTATETSVNSSDISPGANQNYAIHESDIKVKDCTKKTDLNQIPTSVEIVSDSVSKQKTGSPLASGESYKPEEIGSTNMVEYNHVNVADNNEPASQVYSKTVATVEEQADDIGNGSDDEEMSRKPSHGKCEEMIKTKLKAEDCLREPNAMQNNATANGIKNDIFGYQPDSMPEDCKQQVEESKHESEESTSALKTIPNDDSSCGRDATVLKFAKSPSKTVSENELIQSKETDHEETPSSDKVSPDAVPCFESCLKHWRNSCTRWSVINKEKTKLSTRRAIRKSSAAKRLLPFTEDDILNGRWPYGRGDRTASIEEVSKVFIQLQEAHGRNLVLLQRCVSLTHLTLLECGLVSLEGLQSCPSLRHINVSNNDINVISCDGMTRLESLVASHNKLTSIHGLTGCTSLMLLDLSDNNITRINGLESLINLLDLSLANNQLIHIKGLLSISTLLSLNVSGNHLSTLHGIENCGLIRSVIAESNNFSELNFEELQNAVLLLCLNLSRNNLSRLEIPVESSDAPPLWLPSLHTLNLSCNKLTMQDQALSLISCTPNLHTLDLHSNLVSEPRPVFEAVKYLKQLKVVNLSGNLLSNEQETLAVSESSETHFSILFDEIGAETQQAKFEAAVTNMLGFPALKLLDGERSCSASTRVDAVLEALLVERKNAKKLPGWKTSKADTNIPHFYPPDLISQHCEALRTHLELSIVQRKWYEQGQEHATSFLKPSSSVPQAPAIPEQHGRQIEVRTQSYQSPQSSIETVTKMNSEAPKSVPKVEKADAHVHEVASYQSRLSSKAVYEQVEKRRAGALETFAATKIQTIWKMYRARKAYRKLLTRRRQAAELIQSTWRGFTIRQSIKNAMASFNTSTVTGEDGENDDFGEINLDEYNFDEESYDQHWALKTDFVSPTQNFIHKPKIEHLEDKAQQVPSFVHPLIKNEFGAISKPPLPPITPSDRSSPAPRSICANESSLYGNETERSKHSAKEERLTNEWGLNNQLTTELMLKRARKMKGRRKKEASAGDKLKKFHETSQKGAPTQTSVAPRKPTCPPNRVEYFKAREAAFEKRDKQPSEMDEQRQQYTYEWLHTKATCDPSQNVAPVKQSRALPPSSRPRERSRESSSGGGAFLPSIPHRRSLVTSPLQVAGDGDMEVMSVSSYNSGKSRSKHLLRDIARRHGGS